MADILQELISKLSLDADDFTKGVDKAVKSTEGFSGWLDKLADRLISPAGAIGAITAFGTAAFATAMQFDEAMDTIAANTGSVGPSLDRLGESFKNVYAEVPVAASEAAEAIAALNTRLQLQGSALETSSVQLINLSRILKEQLGPLVNATSDAFKRWNVDTSKQNATLDYFYNVAARSGASVTALASELARFAGPLQEAGMSLKTATDLLGSLHLAGVDVAQVMPGIQKSIMEMAKAGVDPSIGFPALVEQIANAKTETEALEVGARSFGTRGGVTLVNAIREGKLSTEQFAKALSAGSISINDMADETDDFGQTWAKVWHQIQVIIEPVGKLILSFFNYTVLGLQAAIPYLKQFWEGWQKVNESVGKFLTFGFLNKFFDENKKSVKDAATQTEALVTSFNRATQAAIPAGQAFESAAEKAKRLKHEHEELEKAQKRQHDIVLKLTAATNETMRAQVDAARAARELDDAIMGLANSQADLSALKTPEVFAVWEQNLTLSTRAYDALQDAAKKAHDEMSRAGLASEVEASHGNTLDRMKTRWDTFGNEVSTIVTNLTQGISESLWDGSLSWKEKGLGALKELGQAVTSLFIQPFTDAIAKFIAGALTDLLSGNGLGGVLDRLKDIGSSISGIFGGGSSAASGAAGSVGGAVSGGGGAAGGVAGAASGVMNTIGAIGAVGSAISGFIGNFQMSGINENIQLAEEQTRRCAQYLGDRADGGILGILFKTHEEIAWGANTKAVESLANEFVGMGAGYIVPSLDTIKSDLSGIASRPTLTINIGGNVIGEDSFIDKLASVLQAKLREQMA